MNNSSEQIQKAQERLQQRREETEGRNHLRPAGESIRSILRSMPTVPAEELNRRAAEEAERERMDRIRDRIAEAGFPDKALKFCNEKRLRVTQMTEYLQEYCKAGKPGWILIHAPAGTGKTSALVQMAIWQIQANQNRRIRYLKFEETVDKILDRSFALEARDLLRYDDLILDDFFKGNFGSEYKSKGAYDLIDTIYSKGQKKRLWMATDITIAEIQAKPHAEYKANILGRIKESLWQGQSRGFQGLKSFRGI